MAKSGPRTTRKYSNRFKATAVKLSQLPGIEVQEVAQSLCIHPFMLSKWRKEAAEGLIVTKGIQLDKQASAELKELPKIKKDYDQLKVEHGEPFVPTLTFTIPNDYIQRWAMIRP